MTILAHRSTLEFLGIKPVGTTGPLVQAPAIDLGTVLRLKELLDLDEAQTARLTGLSVRPYPRRKQHNTPLSSSEADAMLRAARIVEEAIETFGDDDRALRWLKSPSAMLDAMPMDLIASDAGAQAVHEELLRIRWGDYA